MHSFDNLIEGCTAFTLDALHEAQRRLDDEFSSSASTRLVVAARAVQLQKAISAVGMFSMFDAELQNTLASTNGFRSAETLLDAQGETELKKRFIDMQRAVNVLKHGRGSSYGKLLKNVDDLSFRVKLPSENFFLEGDVSEIETLIQVDDAFLRGCAEVIRQISEVIRSVGTHDA